MRTLTPKLLALALATAAIVVAAVLVTRPAKPATVPPVPHALNARQEAQNLEAWLRKYSR